MDCACVAVWFIDMYVGEKGRMLGLKLMLYPGDLLLNGEDTKLFFLPKNELS